MTKFGLFITVFLLITMSSCQSSEAIHFKESLDKSERQAFNIILGKEGSGEKKLEYLEKDDYKNAILQVEQQAKEFDMLIDNIKKLSTEGISKGEPLKNASLAYYTSLKELHFYDKKEIEQQALLRTLKDDKLKDSHNTLITLAKQKKTLYNEVYAKEALLHTAMKDFEAANGF